MSSDYREYMRNNYKLVKEELHNETGRPIKKKEVYGELRKRYYSKDINKEKQIPNPVPKPIGSTPKVTVETPNVKFNIKAFKQLYRDLIKL